MISVTAGTSLTHAPRDKLEATIRTTAPPLPRFSPTGEADRKPGTSRSQSKACENSQKRTAEKPHSEKPGSAPQTTRDRNADAHEPRTSPHLPKRAAGGDEAEAGSAGSLPRPSSGRRSRRRQRLARLLREPARTGRPRLPPRDERRPAPRSPAPR